MLENSLPASFTSLTHYSHWVVAFSGGVDSTVLLHSASQFLRKHHQADGQPLPKLVAIHVDHQLSPNHRQWVEHCEGVCAAWGISLKVVAVDIDRQQSSLERSAREARYEAFRQQFKTLDGEVALLTAHHADDQAETLLLRLLRGSGVRGAGGMATERLFSMGAAKSKLVRPLLPCSKEDILSYARNNKLSWIEDESNDSSAFDRNYLRLEVLPKLLYRWPQLARTFGRFSRLAAESELLNRDLANLDIESLTQRSARFGDSLSLHEYVVLPDYRRRNAIRGWLSKVLHQLPDEKQLQLIDRWLCDTGSSGIYEVGEYSVRKYRASMFLVPDGAHNAEVSVPELTDFDWPAADGNPAALPQLGGSFVSSATGKGLRAGRYSLGTRLAENEQGADSQRGMRVNGMNKSLHKLMQEIGVPAWQRDSYPIIFFKNRVIAIPPLVDDEFVDNDGLAIDWQLNEKE